MNMAPETVSDKPRRTQEERRASSEQALVAAALEVMKARGVAGLTLAAVAAKAGVSTGLVVHLFGNKQGLQLATLSHLRAEFGKRRVRQTESGAQGLELLRSYIRTLVLGLSQPDSNSRIFSALLSEAQFQGREFATEVALMNHAAIRFVRDCLAFENDRGTDFLDDDLNVLATLIVATLRGIVQIHSINASADTVPIDTQQLVKVMEAVIDRKVAGAEVAPTRLASTRGSPPGG